ncbi:MAG: polysaccharide deacetylase family protein [Candidatus Paceibacterota bacterium]
MDSLNLINHANRGENKIALTFDDGPNVFWTEKILSVLDKYGVKANFFVLGKWAEACPEIVKTIYERGHLIGNHSYSHSKETGAFDKAKEIIFGITGAATKFIRPPYLDSKLCASYAPAQCGAAKIIGADVFPRDYEHTAAEIIDFVVKQTQNGSIILLHDGSNHGQDQQSRPGQMFAALPEIIERMRGNFQFARLDEMDLIF